MNDRLRLLLVLGSLSAWMLCMPGCKVINYYFPSSEIELATESFDQGDAPEPINSVSTRGLEVRLWVVDDTHWAAPRKLLGYLHPQGDDEFNNESSVSSLGANTLTQAINPQWAQWGFRFVAVPIGEVDEFLGALRPVQPINVQWLGEFGQWRALVRAGALKNNRVRVGERTVEIAPGRPRLIARSWIEPMLTNDNVIPAVRLDLGMQIESEKNTRTQDLFGVYNERMIEDYGPVIDELLFSALLDGSHALVIVGDAPESRWEMLTDPSQGSPNDGSDGQNNSGAFGPGQEPELGTHQLQGNADARNDRSAENSFDAQRQRPGSEFGYEPIKPVGMTLGELMLTSPGSRLTRANESRNIPKRVVIVLIPRVAGGFSLLGRSGIQPGGDRP